MTPLQISMMLHFHVSPSKYEPWGSAQSEAMDWFVKEKLVEFPVTDRVRLTERGKAYVSFLQTMPLPVANWAIPGPWVPSLPGDCF